MQATINNGIQDAQTEKNLFELSDSTSEIVFETLEKNNLNWSVRKENLITQSGLSTQSVGIFRSDNNAWLGTVSPKYTPYQNKDLIATIIEASNHIGLNVATGGVLKQGQKVFIQLELPEEFIGKSPVKRYITALNSHNGKSSIAFGSTNTVVVCENTFYRTYKELQKFRHATSSFEKIKIAVMEMKNSIREDVKLMETFKLMSSLNINDEVLEKVMLNTFNVDLNKNMAHVNKRVLEKMDKIAKSIETEKNLEGNTLWGLFNGITRYTNHVINHKGTKNDNIMTGMGYIHNLTAFNTIVDWIEKNTKETAPVNI